VKAGVCEDDIEFTPLFSEPIDRALGRFDIEGVAIADLMKEVGLTVGGFYNRFDSRDDLVLEALRAASGPWQKQVLAAESGGPPLTYESLIDSYLSESHRDHPGNGCPIGALACDIGRGSKHIRSFLTERVKSHFELLSNLLPQDDSNQKKIVVPKKVLVTGASGLLGVAAIGKFLSAGWDVVGVSRLKPELPSGRDVEFLSVDLQDEKTARAAFEPLTDITHIAYTALHEKPELVAGWSSKEQIETNNAMLRNVVQPIVRTASNFQHISILQGTKIYGVHLHPIRIPARERDVRRDHENFYFDHEDYVRQMGAEHGFNYTALRPQLVTGPTLGALNVLPAIGAYAAIRREKGEPFGFPGGPSFVWEAADADLVADVMVWAAQSPQAANEAFNITNGDAFEWRNVWLALGCNPRCRNRAGYANERGSLSRGKRGCLGPDRREVRSSLAEPPGTGWPRGPARGLRVRLRRLARTSGLREHDQAAPVLVHQDN